MTELIIAVGLAVSISAVCSLFEAVLYAVPLRHIETMAKAGRREGRILKDLRRQVERPIAAILSLNTIAHTAGAAFAGAAATAVFGHQWLAYFSVLFTLAILLFSEIIPKTAGVVYGRSLVAVVAYPLKGLVWIMTPAIWLSGLVTRLISRGRHEEAITAEEIQVMANLSRRTGGILSYQEQTISRVLTLQEKTAKEVMTPRTVVFSLSGRLTLREAVAAAGGWEHSRIPVYDRDMEDVVGIVHTRDILIALSEGHEDKRLSDLMRPVHFVAETARLDEVLSEFLELRQHLFAVIDEYGGLSGIISLEDVLEEILGREIVDESDEVADKQEFARQRKGIT
ncbi:MAG: HlyC/CorC family transporter [Deltaproteobacteria bacterium]|nr:HlyC/CorC family transporter [Deltaproteobacteria bacterium]MBW2048382.1 HlyC/CorC family transporter [Deltaproteobacteria bacterium]MBW2110986.1 HlyC/CorC family transporter [Deltaproteobacteria bacterium]MBW2354208.1 HlyC/CorC family transporter [Deltaproteobacteria bacterium]HDZ90806.1 HlyC/CorC family transporter [Deltaproteobacteria bacterium]